MSQVAIIVTANMIVASGVLDNKREHVEIKAGTPLYDKALQAIKDGDEQEVLVMGNLAKQIEKFSDGLFYVLDGLVYIDGVSTPAPSALSDKIVGFAKDGLPVEPLVRFWQNLSANPSERSRDQLYSFLEHNKIPLTPDGCFVAYRGVTEDEQGNLWDCHSGRFNNNPGQVVSMPRDQVDSDPNRTCSSGLHVAAFEYANGFGSVLVHVKVNPRDVVSVPTDYNGQKMRVCEFTVLDRAGARQEIDDRLVDIPDDLKDEEDIYDAEDDSGPEIGVQVDDDVSLTYVRARSDGSVELPVAAVARLGLGNTVDTEINSIDGIVTVCRASDGARVARNGMRIAARTLRNADIDGAGEYAVEFGTDGCVTISVA